jgi:uncharacterized protein (DUF2252 family)
MVWLFSLSGFAQERKAYGAEWKAVEAAMGRAGRSTTGDQS